LLDGRVSGPKFGNRGPDVNAVGFLFTCPDLGDRDRPYEVAPLRASAPVKSEEISSAAPTKNNRPTAATTTRSPLESDPPPAMDMARPTATTPAIVHPAATPTRKILPIPLYPFGPLNRPRYYFRQSLEV
jgi:hypothetical protein